MFLMQGYCFRRSMWVTALLFVTLALSGSLSRAFEPSPPLTSQLGGPYFIGSNTLPSHLDGNDVLKKVAEFEAFHKAEWNASEVAVLSEDLFRKSVEANRKSGLPYENLYQRYNYVVQKSEKGKNEFQILVAIWSFKSSGWWSTSTRKFYDICRKEPVNPQYDNAVLQNEVMVNFFPEDLSLPSNLTENAQQPPSSKIFPCTIDIVTKGISVDFSTFPIDDKINEIHKDRGVLDAHSKHFMLAQGSGTAFKNYPPLNTRYNRIYVKDALEHQWAQKPVEYAGEILVDVIGCQYFINSGSGTYQPNPGTKMAYLLEVAKVFDRVLGFPPTLVWDSQKKESMSLPSRDDNNKNLICPHLDPIDVSLENDGKSKRESYEDFGSSRQNAQRSSHAMPN